MASLVGIVLYVTAVIAQSPPAGLPGTVQGTVCEVGNCVPIAGARVVLTMPGANGARRVTVSDRAGMFAFAKLPAGKYQLTVDADDFTEAAIPPIITVTDGTAVPAMHIEMRSLGIISGRAFDEKGEPLTGARAEALVFRSRILTPISSVDTDDRGEFRLSGLDPDEYYIRITPPTNRPIQDNFPTTFYPNTTDPATAAKIVITAGSEVAGIEPRLASRGVKIRGQLVNPQSDNVTATLFVLPRSPSVIAVPSLGPNTVDRTSDDFEIRGVAAGSYYLYALTGVEPRTGPQWMRVPLEVGEKDIENISIPMLPTGTIKGRIVIATDVEDSGNLDLSTLSLHAVGAGTLPIPGWSAILAQVNKAGEFQFAHLSEQPFFFTDQIFADEWFISEIRFEGGDAMTSGFSATPAKESSLEVIISNASGKLTGVIKNANDTPIPAGRLVLLPEPSLRSNPFLIRTGVAIEKGAFMIETIPPGEYTAIALPDRDEFTPVFLRDLQSVGNYERFGQHVHIGARATTRVDLIAAPVN